MSCGHRVGVKMGRVAKRSFSIYFSGTSRDNEPKFAEDSRRFAQSVKKDEQRSPFKAPRLHAGLVCLGFEPDQLNYNNGINFRIFGSGSHRMRPRNMRHRGNLGKRKRQKRV
jgi:hypothetical protein